MNSCLLGIDLGTSGLRSILFDQKGTVVASAVRDYPIVQQQNGWAEQNPEDWWAAAVWTIRQAIDQAGGPKLPIAGIGLSGQMHGLVMLDADGRVLRNCILWCDGRTGEQCSEMTQRVGAEALVRLSGNPALAGFTAAKILWVRKHEPDIYKQCRHILLPKDYLRYRLTGELATDVSDASGTNLLDISRRVWSKEILSFLDIDLGWMPRLYESTEITGQVTPSAARQTGLTQGIPVVGGAADNAAAAVGTGVVEQGKAFVTIGTSGVIFAHSDSVSIDPKGSVHTLCSAVPGAWANMSCTLSAGLSLQWMRNQFFSQEHIQVCQGESIYAALDRMAETIPIGAERLLFLPYLMGERSPLLDPEARGVFFGLSNIHTRVHLLRAVMEGVAYAQRHCLDALEETGAVFQELLITGGGGTSALWRQMLADLFGRPVATVKTQGGAALGAALLAGVGTGVYPHLKAACSQVIRTNPPQSPVPEHSAAYQPYYSLYRELYPSLQHHFHTLIAL